MSSTCPKLSILWRQSEGLPVEQALINETLASLVAKSEQDPATAVRTTDSHFLFMESCTLCGQAIVHGHEGSEAASQQATPGAYAKNSPTNHSQTGAIQAVRSLRRAM